MSNGEEVAREAHAAGFALFANTVTPSGYRTARARFADAPGICLGLGMHPWWVDGTVFDSEEFEALAHTTSFIGEVGLDFGKRGQSLGNQREQLDTFTAIANICARQGGKLLSIHSVKAANEVLDVLEHADVFATCTCIFHWFSDSSDALDRARKDGCYFSINPHMLETRRGREYIRQIPPNRLLLETDDPPGEGVPYDFATMAASLQRVRDHIDANVAS